ncbi:MULTISPECIES: hypothetical protein [unclassified Streptomyces]|uniref:hypothetical protein n=1 Tax=unclassified Streptomyces TaxID=2593676 RepID=UPI00136943C5|nr:MULTISPECIES: hypothetical protein [unclassified Streptomyces]NDZ84768.1 hypothetical protein [Streptomyces sp. SID10115]NDZ98744.1 hypothetical protein [Streptomyces sp. SID10116]MYY83394.1 hypothetical protein [Streptomyces sp. SID335]MYZ15732.1 hypothetical protein [Streptomyces sp. SID337]NEB43039.1 hypothetical protein [Streptomyces sp. SID339]
MGTPDTNRIDRDIRTTKRKLEAAAKREMWALNGPERRALVSAMGSVTAKVVRHKNTTRAEEKAAATWESARTRLQAEINALQVERDEAVRRAAADKAAKKAAKSSGWW